MIFFFFLQVESFLLQQLGLVGSSNCLMGISKPPELLPVPSYILASWSFLVEFFFCRLLLLFPILEFLPFKLFQFRCSWTDLPGFYRNSPFEDHFLVTLFDCVFSHMQLCRIYMQKIPSCSSI